MRPSLRIIPAALVLSALALLGWTIFGEASPHTEPAQRFELAQAARTNSASTASLDAADLMPAESPSSAGATERSGGDTGGEAERYKAFYGEALIQVGGALPSPVKVGSLEVEIMERGASKLVEVDANGGHFSLQIPERSRVRLRGGVFNGQRVRFPGLGVAFAPVESAYALVGTPFPLNQLTVLDGPTGAHLSSLRITRAAGQSPVTLRDQADREEVVLEEASSPVALPWIESRSPVWLRVQAEGYAPATVWVDPAEESAKSLALWANADLELRVTGDGREALKMITLFHDAGEGRTAASSIIERRAPGVKSDPEAWIFDLVGLPALPTQVVLKGIDIKARPVDLASSNVDLESGGRQTLTLRLRR